MLKMVKLILTLENWNVTSDGMSTFKTENNCTKLRYSFTKWVIVVIAHIHNSNFTIILLQFTFWCNFYFLEGTKHKLKFEEM